MSPSAILSFSIFIYEIDTKTQSKKMYFHLVGGFRRITCFKAPRSVVTGSKNKLFL